VVALLFVVGLPLMAQNSKRAPADLVLVGVLAIMFGWYAVRGRKGLPGFLTKKLGD
jgi:hypothetical protein